MCAYLCMCTFVCRAHRGQKRVYPGSGSEAESQVRTLRQIQLGREVLATRMHHIARNTLITWGPQSIELPAVLKTLWPPKPLHINFLSCDLWRQY